MFPTPLQKQDVSRICDIIAHTSSLDTNLTRNTHAHPTSPRSTGFCAIWDCISSSSSSIAHDLARTHVSYYSDDANQAHQGHVQAAHSEGLGHTAHRGWARLLLDRARDIIIHGPAYRGANGAAMPTDEGDQDGHFFFNHPERGGYFAA